MLASTGLTGPYGLAFDASGNLYTANSVGSFIEQFTPGGIASVFSRTGLQTPNGLAFQPVLAATAVPEPSSLTLLSLGMASLSLDRRKRA